MTLCVNCMHEATYIVENLGTSPQIFCDEHLPKFYHKNRLPHNVKLIEETQVVEEPVIEEAVVEKPKPARKKKSAAAPAEAVAESAE